MKALYTHPLSIGGLYALSRALLAPLSPVPGAVPLDPLWAFAARGGRAPSVIQLIALLPGLLLGDLLAGLPWPTILLRAVGLAAMALMRVEGGFHRRYAVWMVNHALFSSVMPDWLGDYPLGFLYAVWLIQGILWWGLAAPRGESLPWKSILPALALPGTMVLLHVFFQNPPLWPRPALGDTSGFGLRLAATLLLLIPIPALYRRYKPHRPDLGGSGGSRWMRLAD